MTTFITDDVFGSSTLLTLEEGEGYFIGRNATIGSTNGTAIFGADVDNARLVITGTVAGLRGAAAFSSLSSTSVSSDNEVVITETGLLTAELFQPLFMIGNRNAVTNNGEIVALGTTGIEVQGDDSSIQNSGSVTASNPNNSASRAISMTGDGHSLTNTGLLQSATSTAATVQMETADGESSTTLNFGQILGTGVAFAGGTGNDALVNGGQITGDIFLSSGNDSYRVLGDAITTNIVFGGTGSDQLRGGSLEETFFGEGDSDLLLGRGGDDQLFGGSGDDEIAGGGGDDALYGGSNADILRGGSGDDTVFGGSGNDLVGGGAGEDVLYGDSGEDTLRGSDGDDTLYGDTGDDVLYGGAGDDRLYGGTGVDQFFGNAGADTFVWEFIEEGGTSTATSDVILDFEVGTDFIDLSLLGDLNFGRRTGTPEVFVSVANGTSFVRIDTDGDGARDLQIIVRDTVLTEDDFLL